MKNNLIYNSIFFSQYSSYINFEGRVIQMPLSYPCNLDKKAFAKESEKCSQNKKNRTIK